MRTLIRKLQKTDWWERFQIGLTIVAILYFGIRIISCCGRPL